MPSLVLCCVLSADVRLSARADLYDLVDIYGGPAPRFKTMYAPWMTTGETTR